MLNDIEIWTDGSASLGKKATFAYVLVRNDNVIREGCGRVTKPPYTAPQAEVAGVMAGIKATLDLVKEEKKYSPVHLYCDSEFLVKTLNEWGPKRKPHQWQGKAYSEEFQGMLKVIEEYRKHASFLITHVRSHQGNKYNEMVDKMALAELRAD